MVRLAHLPEDYAERLLTLPLPTFDSTPWVAPPDLRRARVALVSTAGLHPRGAPEFVGGLGDYRVLPGEIDVAEIVMSHGSVNFDRSGFFQDVNTVFPIERLRDLASAGEIGSVAAWHYSFMGATDPARMEPAAREVARLLREDDVTAALLVPV